MEIIILDYIPIIIDQYLNANMHTPNKGPDFDK